MNDHWWLHSTELRSNRYGNEDADDDGDNEGLGEGFQLEFRTHGSRALIISGDRTLFTNPGRMATESEIQHLGEQIIRALNTATGELEGHAEAEGV